MLRKGGMTLDWKQICFTAAPNFEQPAFNEILEFDPKAKLKQRLTAGICIVELNHNSSKLFEYFSQNQPIFIRHICPLQVKAELLNNDLKGLIDAVNPLLSLMNMTKSFSVQSRVFSNHPLHHHEINRRLSSEITRKGFKLDVKHPYQVISIFCIENTVYLGISLAKENLSNWLGGECRFVRGKGRISRSEFKLLEAINVFNLKLPQEGLALDMGAAPGGWSRLLLKNNLRVIAVDPAELHPSIRMNPNLVHYKQVIRSYLRKNKRRFDLVVNDMRIDTLATVKIMDSVSKYLPQNALAIVNLKLPTKGFVKKVNTALNILKRKYEIIGARQLFHNRQEITVILKKPRQAYPTKELG